MKTKYLLLIMGALLLAAGSWAGRAAWRIRRQVVTLDVRNLPLREVLRKIQWQTWTKIRAEQALDARITLHVKDKPLPYVLDRLAEQAGARWSTLYAVYNSTHSVTVFKCPSDKLGLFTAEGSSYEWNADLNGHRIDETKTANMFLVWRNSNGPVRSTNIVLRFPPETTPVLLDYEEFHPRPPKQGKNVVYMDGHVAPLDVPE